MADGNTFDLPAQQDAAERDNLVPVGNDDKPDWDAAPYDLRPDWGPYEWAASHWEDGSKAWFRASKEEAQYLVAETRTYQVDGEKVTETLGFSWRKLCGGLIPLATLRDEHGGGFGVLCAIHTAARESQTVTIPRAIIGGPPSELGKLLSSLGLQYKPDTRTRQKIAEYLHERPLNDVWRSINKPGWASEGAFVFPDTSVLAEGAEPVIFQSADGRPTQHNFNQRGDLNTWRDTVAAPLENQKRGVFALSAAFAGPLLEPLELEGGGFHLRGDSSCGKTTLLRAAGSVWGGGRQGYIRPWRATDNGTEGVAALHNGTLLCLDELALIKPDAASSVAYMLANGEGKTRFKRDASLRASHTWRVIFLSSGEISLSDKVQQDPKAGVVMAGQDARFIDLPADAGHGYGVWDFTIAAAKFSESINEAANKSYGHAGRAFVERILGDYEGAIQRASELMREFMTEVNLSGAEGQVRRVAQRFALVAAAGELASAWGVLPYAAGVAKAATAQMFREWIKERGGVANSEQRTKIQAVVDFISRHGRSRFEDLSSEDFGFSDSRTSIPDHAGFIKQVDDVKCYCFSSAAFKEATKGFNAKSVKEKLQSKGLLRHNKTSLDKTVNIKGKSRKLICVSADIMDIGE